jgi:hypothetical protein
MNRQFSEEELQMVYKCMKQCSTSLAVKELEIQTKIRFCFTSVRLVIQENNKTNAGEDAGGGQRSPYPQLLVEIQTSATIWKSVWRFLKKLKMDLPYDPTIPFWGIYSKKCKSIYKSDTCTPMSIAALFTTVKLWNQPRCPTMDEQIKKMCYIYKMEYFCHKEKLNYVQKNGWNWRAPC